MYDEADIGLVDPETERVRGNDDAQRAVHDLGLDPLAVDFLEAAVIMRGGNCPLPQPPCGFLCRSRRGTVNDAAASSAVRDSVGERRFVSFDKQLVEDRLILAVLLDAHNLQVQVRTIRFADENPRDGASGVVRRCPAESTEGLSL